MYIIGGYKRLFSRPRLASRPEFWIFAGYFFPILVGLVVLGVAIPWGLDFLRVVIVVWGLPTVAALLLMIPGRLRDAGYPMHYMFVLLIPLVGGILLLIALSKPSVKAMGGGVDIDGV